MSAIAWSDDEQDALLFENVDTDTVKITHHHLDEFDADDDFSEAVGEFSLDALRRALLTPAPAAEHVANRRTNFLATWLERIGKKR